MRTRTAVAVVTLSGAFLLLPLPGCGGDGSPAGVVRAYAAALDDQDGERAAALMSADMNADAPRWLPVYASVIETYGVEVLQESVDPTGTQATVRVREKADLVVGGTDYHELVFTLHWVDGRWRIAGIADLSPADALPKK